MADVTGKLFFKLRGLRLQWLLYSSNASMALQLRIKKVTYGRGLRFWGISTIVRFPGSTISIGDRCSFRSDSDSNLIGIKGKCILSTHAASAEITIGKNCGFSGTVIGCKEKITLGNHVLCGANTLITDFDWHGIDPAKRRTSSGNSKPITIGNNVFIGYGTVILKGVQVGDNSVIGANSVVTRDIPANVIAGGNPCKVLRPL